MDFEDFFSQKLEVRRSSSIFSDRTFLKEFPSSSFIDLEKLLTEIFITNGRLLH